MTTSGTAAWSLTARDIITAALQENGIVGLGETPTAEESDVCLLRLNAILKSWPVGLHLQSQATVSFTAGVSTVTLAAGVERVAGARLVNSATNHRTLYQWERDEYMSLPNKVSSGPPSIFYAAQTNDGVTLTVWPVPTATTSVIIDYLRKPETVTSLNETVDFPERYTEALYAMLAVRCAGIFAAPLTPELVARAERLRREAEDAERPDAYYLGQDCC